MLGVQKVARENTRQYGIVKTGRRRARLHTVAAIVEKPQPEVAPSTLAVVGRYILTPRDFSSSGSSVQARAGGEIQLTDGIAALLSEEKVLAYRFEGVRYDCGSKLGYLQAKVAYGLQASGSRRASLPRYLDVAAAQRRKPMRTAMDRMRRDKPGRFCESAELIHARPPSMRRCSASPRKSRANLLRIISAGAVA